MRCALEVAGATEGRGCSAGAGGPGLGCHEGRAAEPSRFRQVLTTELLRCGLDLVGKSWRRDFRLLFNSMQCSQI